MQHSRDSLLLANLQKKVKHETKPCGKEEEIPLAASVGRANLVF